MSQSGSATAGGDVAESVESSDLDAVVARHGDDHNRLPNNVPVADPFGVFTTISAHGSIDLNNDFFQDLGTNGRRCVTCHVPTVGWTITSEQLQTVFDATDGGKFDDGLGLSAVFRTVDGSNSPTADVSTLAKRRQAYSMLGSQPPTREMLLQGPRSLGKSRGSARELELDHERIGDRRDHRSRAPPGGGVGPWVRRAPARTLMAAWTRLIFFGQELSCCRALSSRREVPVRDRG